MPESKLFNPMFSPAPRASPAGRPNTAEETSGSTATEQDQKVPTSYLDHNANDVSAINVQKSTSVSEISSNLSSTVLTPSKRPSSPYYSIGPSVDNLLEESPLVENSLSDDCGNVPCQSGPFSGDRIENKPLPLGTERNYIATSSPNQFSQQFCSSRNSSGSQVDISAIDQCASASSLEQQVFQDPMTSTSMPVGVNVQGNDCMSADIYQQLNYAMDGRQPMEDMPKSSHVMNYGMPGCRDLSAMSQPMGRSIEDSMMVRDSLSMSQGGSAADCFCPDAKHPNMGPVPRGDPYGSTPDSGASYGHPDHFVFPSVPVQSSNIGTVPGAFRPPRSAPRSAGFGDQYSGPPPEFPGAGNLPPQVIQSGDPGLLAAVGGLRRTSSCIARRPRSEKKPIPDEQKDTKYFERRRRNNEAAKKSRDARKSREDEIAIRASFLEKENLVLRTQVQKLKDEAQDLRNYLNANGDNYSAPQCMPSPGPFSGARGSQLARQPMGGGMIYPPVHSSLHSSSTGGLMMPGSEMPHGSGMLAPSGGMALSRMYSSS